MRMCRIIKYFELLKVNYVFKIEFKKYSMFFSSRFIPVFFTGFAVIEAVFFVAKQNKICSVSCKKHPQQKNPLA